VLCCVVLCCVVLRGEGESTSLERYNIFHDFLLWSSESSFMTEMMMGPNSGSMPIRFLCFLPSKNSLYHVMLWSSCSIFFDGVSCCGCGCCGELLLKVSSVVRTK